MNNNNTKKYESFKIPSRQHSLEDGNNQSSAQISTNQSGTSSDEMYYEIEYDAHPIPGVGKFVKKLKPQRIKEPEYDPIREQFGQMRDIARAHRSTYDFSMFFDRRSLNDNAIIFYEQALFMKDFTDNYEGNAQFTQYFPYYQMMGYEQLRTYFTWRTQVRQGNVTETSLSYAFLYIYELIANVGVENPQDGLEKLIFFWKAFRKYKKNVDRYVLRWLKDYHIYYELPHTFKEFVEKNELAEHYPKLSWSDDSFELFCSISKYNIKKSAFYTDGTCQMISECFAFVLDRIRRDFEMSGMNFDDAFFRPTRKLIAWKPIKDAPFYDVAKHPTRKFIPWKPFKDALFYDAVKHPDKQIILSKNEIYICKNSEWEFSTAITTEKGRQFIGYVMKQMESTLRKITKYRFKLTANTDMINNDTVRILTKAGLFIENIVAEAVMEYHKEATKIIVTVNPVSLSRIREEALTTQESLIVEEQMPLIITEPAPTQFTEQDKKIFTNSFDELEKTPVSDVWKSLKEILNHNELQALKVILERGDIKMFADECGVMLEVLVDGINEKAMDCIGDNLMDDDFVLYDDYINQVKELIR